MQEYDWRYWRLKCDKEPMQVIEMPLEFPHVQIRDAVLLRYEEENWSQMREHIVEGCSF